MPISSDTSAIVVSQQQQQTSTSLPIPPPKTPELIEKINATAAEQRRKTAELSNSGSQTDFFKSKSDSARSTTVHEKTEDPEKKSDVMPT